MLLRATIARPTIPSPIIWRITLAERRQGLYCRTRCHGKDEGEDPVMPFCEALKMARGDDSRDGVDEGAVNNVILVFIGRQNLQGHLVQLSSAAGTEDRLHTEWPKARRMTKDDIIALSQYDYLVMKSRHDESIGTEPVQGWEKCRQPNEKAAYGHYAEQRKHINTFCGTGNNPEFLSDPTGNRRWSAHDSISPREIRSIYEDSAPRLTPSTNSDFRYWFTDEEIKQNRHNCAFEAPRY